MKAPNVTLRVVATDASGNTASCESTVPESAPTPTPDCDECKGKVTELTLQFNGDEPATIRVEQKKDHAVVFEGAVQPGGQFTFVGTDKHGTLGTEITVFVNGEEHTKIHTSCSQPIGPGLVSDDFLVVAGKSKDGGPLCPVENGGEDDGGDD